MITNRFSRLLLVLVIVMIVMTASTCSAPTVSNIVVSKDASESYGTAIDGGPVLIESFSITVNTCNIGSDGSHTNCSLHLISPITRDTFLKNTVGQEYRP